MTHRMKWAGEGEEEDDDSDEEIDDEGAAQLSKFNTGNYCKDLWTGQAVHRKFQGFKFVQTGGEKDTKKELKDYAMLWGEMPENQGGVIEGMGIGAGLEDEFPGGEDEEEPMVIG